MQAQDSKDEGREKLKLGMCKDCMSVPKLWPKRALGVFGAVRFAFYILGAGYTGLAAVQPKSKYLTPL